MTETAQSNERCKKREPANENERGGLRPLPLLFPTASWSSYHPSDLDSSSYDEGSSKTFNSTIYSHSDNSCYDELSESEPTGASSRISTILSLVRGGDHQDVVHAPDGRSPQRAKRRRFAKSFRPWKPWRFSASRRSRTPERAHALLCLALSDPALSTAALLASEQTQKGPNAACDKEGKVSLPGRYPKRKICFRPRLASAAGNETTGSWQLTTIQHPMRFVKRLSAVRARERVRSPLFVYAARLGLHNSLCGVCRWLRRWVRSCAYPPR